MFFATLVAQAKTNIPTTTLTEPLAAPLPTPTVTETVAPVMHDFSVWTRIAEADWLVQFTLLILLGFSVGCWAVIIYKYFQLKSAQKTSVAFWNKFSRTGNMAEIMGTKSLRDGPMYEIFLTGQESLGKIKKTTSQMSDYHRDYLGQRLRQSKESEMDKLEQYISFLATTAAVAPFIGLFGTVWGILTAFMEIAKKGSSTLQTVGPFIAEALVATAVGLFAAIPAVVAYNYFVGRIRSIGKLINIFMDDFMLKSDREVAP